MTTPAIYDAVFFDLGGTLFQHLPASLTHANLRAVTAQLPGAEAIEADDLIATYKRYRAQVEREALYRAFFIHRTLVADALARTLAEFAIDTHGASGLFCDAQRDAVTTQLQLRAETPAVLKGLREMGLYTAIVSNIDDDYIVPLLSRTGIESLFDYWISSQRAGSCKPHWHIYQQALAAAAVPAERVLFVGDSYAHDVVGARRAGMATALLTADLGENVPTGADYEIASLADLPQIITG